MSEISGYPQLTDKQIEVINFIKGLERNLKTQFGGSLMNLVGESEPDKRMLALAMTNIEQGFMWLVKSIAKPA